MNVPVTQEAVPPTQVALPVLQAGVDLSLQVMLPLASQVGPLPVAQLGGPEFWVPGQSLSAAQVAGGFATGLQGSTQPAGAGTFAPVLGSVAPNQMGGAPVLKFTAPESAGEPARFVMNGLPL